MGILGKGRKGVAWLLGLVSLLSWSFSLLHSASGTFGTVNKGGLGSILLEKVRREDRDTDLQLQQNKCVSCACRTLMHLESYPELELD